MQTITRIVGAGLLFTLSLVTAAQAAGDLTTLRTHLDQQRTAEAWALAEKLHAPRAGNPDFDFLYARAALAARRPSQAIFALERVRLQQPNNHEAWLLLARAHLEVGDPTRARRELEALLSSNPSALIRAQSQALDVPRGPGPTRPWRGFIGFDVGYDSNVNSATDAVTVTGIGGDPTVGVILATDNRAQRDSFARLSTGYGGSLRLGAQTSLFADASAYVNALSDQNQFNTLFYQARVGTAWQTGPHRLALPISRQVLHVDHSRYYSYDLAALEWTYRFKPSQTLSLAASRGLASYDNQPTRDTRATAALLGWNMIMGRAQFGLNARYGQEDARVDTLYPSGQSNAFTGRHTTALGFDVRYRLWPRHEPRLSLLWQRSGHDGVDPDFAQVRNDRYATVAAGWDWRAWPGWLLRAEVSYAANGSNIDLYDYDKTQVLLGVRHEFH